MTFTNELNSEQLASLSPDDAFSMACKIFFDSQEPIERRLQALDFMFEWRAELGRLGQ